MSDKKEFKKVVAEMIGTFGIVFTGCGSLMVAERFPQTVPAAAVPLVFGLTVAAMVYALGHLSGAHFNPAVTVAFAIARHFPARLVLPYWLAQMAGALLALALLAQLLPAGLLFGATLPHVSTAQALGWEFILTFILMFVVISVATDTRAVGTMAGAAIGGTVILCSYVGGPVTGASMNPARSFAPALWEGRLDFLWIYILGPALGAVCAALVYEWMRGEPALLDDAHA